MNIYILINLRLVQIGKKYFLVGILVVAVIQPNRKSIFNCGTACRMKRFRLFLEKKVHLVVKMAGK